MKTATLYQHQEVLWNDNQGGKYLYLTLLDATFVVFVCFNSFIKYC